MNSLLEAVNRKIKNPNKDTFEIFNFINLLFIDIWLQFGQIFDNYYITQNFQALVVLLHSDKFPRLNLGKKDHILGIKLDTEIMHN